MARIFSSCCLIFILIFTGNSGALAQGREMTQYSTIDVLMKGIYDGYVPIGEMLRHGDTGIGTFDGLDGEMVVVDGIAYQVTADGVVHIPAPTMTTPFAEVTFFHDDQEKVLPPGANLESFTREVDAIIPTPNIFYAVRIDGTFAKVITRSVPKQPKPYRPLTEIVKTQPTFTFENVRGVIVGWRCPAFVKGINVPGYHLHFLTEDRKGGGHILEFVVKDATVKLSHTSDFHMILPESGDFYKLNLDSTSEAVYRQVESNGGQKASRER
ncbi:MAG: acetolactate decarboxylase [Syntrophobacteraceae bacterium]|jgi:acetolactate decarboxylase